mgnify:CR=1 FL=1
MLIFLHMYLFTVEQDNRTAVILRSSFGFCAAAGKNIVRYGHTAYPIRKNSRVLQLIKTVSGNCDMMSMEPPWRKIEVAGLRIFMTHGHLYDVKYGLERIAARAYADGADIVLFGHTHNPISKYLPEGTELEFVGKTERPLLLFNPGTAGMGFDHTFGRLTFSGGEVFPSHGKI